jgi:membrane-associated phospholipid phosphatase
MVRFPTASRVLRETFPDDHVGVYDAVTSLGDATVVLFAVAVLYWVGRRRETAAATGYALVALSLVVVLKHAFAMPRPPEAVRLIAEDGYGFPSGHATAAAVVYGGIAYEYDWHRRLATALPVAALVLAIALSRVVLGVHYLGDVVAGLALGVATVLGVARLTDGRPFPTFVLAAGCAIVAVLASGASENAVLAFGASLGAVVGAYFFERVPDSSDATAVAVTVALGLTFVVAVQVLAGLAGESLLVLGASNGVVVAGVLLLPVAVAWLPVDGLGPW